MKIALALLLNATLLALLLPWLRRQWRAAGRGGRAALAAGLGARLAVGLATGRHLVHDADYMSTHGRALTAQMWADPMAALHTLDGDVLSYGGYVLEFHGMSNTFFFVKTVAFLNLASLNTDWLNALYFAVFSFVGCWQLARAVGRALPGTPAGAALVAFVLWPSVLVWASGVTKEAVVLGSGAWLLALFIALFLGPPVSARGPRWGKILLLLGLAVVHFKMRYFFAMPLLGALAALGVVLGLQRLGWARRRRVQLLVMAAVLGGGVWVASEVSVAFRLNKFTNQVLRIYGKNLSTSLDKPHFEYPHLQPTLGSIGRHAPLAVANALTRPWLGESRLAQYVAASLENLVLLGLLAVALLAAGRGRLGRLPFGLGVALVLHCVVLAVLLGLSSPNLGSLHRYRSGLLPYLLLLLLQNDYAARALQHLGLSNPSCWRRAGRTPSQRATAGLQKGLRAG